MPPARGRDPGGRSSVGQMLPASTAGDPADRAAAVGASPLRQLAELVGQLVRLVQVLGRSCDDIEQTQGQAADRHRPGKPGGRQGARQQAGRSRAAEPGCEGLQGCPLPGAGSLAGVPPGGRAGDARKEADASKLGQDAGVKVQLLVRDGTGARGGSAVTHEEEGMWHIDPLSTHMDID